MTDPFGAQFEGSSRLLDDTDTAPEDDQPTRVFDPATLAARPEPGNFWWDTQVAIALNGREKERRALIRARDAAETGERRDRYEELLRRLRFDATERLTHLVGMAERNAR